MNFQSLTNIQDADFYLDQAFKEAKKKADAVRIKVSGEDRLKKSICVEVERIKSVRRSLGNNLDHILKSYPSLDDLPDFYQDLVKCTIDYVQLKKSFGALNWARKRLIEFFDMHLRQIRRCKDYKYINTHRRSFYGRVSSLMKQINPNLKFLEESRKIMKSYPAIKTSMPTVVIAGFPNVGKTTLLRALTGADPKIASYPFTTQKLMLGYIKEDEASIQFIDTPGLLDRPFSSRNKIEQQSILALKHVASGIVLIIDASETCGYTVKEQLNLLRELKKAFGLPIQVVLNKSDISEKKALSELKKKFKDVIEISAEKGDLKNLKENLISSYSD
ncbi:MAG: GTP-binding protein [bacterium]|nr:GTP-binding protein [bacterium]